MTVTVESYVQGRWVRGEGSPTVLVNPATEAALAECLSGGVDFAAALEHGRRVGGPALRRLTFAQRAEALEALGRALHAHRAELLDLSVQNAGATRSDAKFDVDGGTGTLAAYARFGRDLGEAPLLADGEGVQLGRTARFWGRHVLAPRPGVAVHINAFNFPAWNMLEKAACALLAGVPVLEKPGIPTALVAARVARIVIESGILPEGAWQFVVSEPQGLLDHVGPQDVVAFTGSSATAARIRSHPNLIRHAVRLNVEADSLNAAVLAPDAEPDGETWRLFLSNVVLDVRQKAGQKCTAVRRVLVPAPRLETVKEALAQALGALVVGDPAEDGVEVGPVVSRRQMEHVREGIRLLAGAGAVACGGPDPVAPEGYFVAPTLVVAADAEADVVHREEVFGPVTTLLPYDGTAAEAARLVARGEGGLVASLYGDDLEWIREAVLALAPWHGRLWLGSRKVAEHALPPGAVLPATIHGGPGRAGGGEELGGLRGLAPYLQRTALQGFKGHVEGLVS